jgi:hypothetical protein
VRFLPVLHHYSGASALGAADFTQKQLKKKAEFGSIAQLFSKKTLIHGRYH